MPKGKPNTSFNFGFNAVRKPPKAGGGKKRRGGKTRKGRKGSSFGS